MKISYKKLWILLIEKDISPATLRKDLNIATGTMTKMRKNEEVALRNARTFKLLSLRVRCIIQSTFFINRLSCFNRVKMVK